MSDDITLRQLRYFLRTVACGSFSAAARAEHVAQPSLSEQIRRLERQVGGPLFTRTSRRLQLTDLGRAMVPLAEQAAHSVDTLAGTLRRARDLQGGTVSFGTFSGAYLYFFVPLVRDFRQRHPNVALRVVGLNSAAVADAVREGELEAGLVQLPIDAHGLQVSEPVLVDSAVYVSADPDAVRNPVTIETLAATELILSDASWRDRDPLRRSIADRARRAGVTIEPILEVEYQTAALALAVAGVGDTVASYLVARQSPDLERFSWRPLDPPLLEQFSLITRVGAVPSPATRHFMELVRIHASALQVHTATWLGLLAEPLDAAPAEMSAVRGAAQH